MGAMLVGASVATDLVAPEFLNVLLPVCAAALIIYVWAMRGRHL
jgi:hypothetical protein